MQSIYQYIVEAKQTSSNKERLEQLRSWLKGKKYEDYVDTLNKMLEDPKAKTLLDEGFGSEFGDLKFKYSAKMIRANDLFPTQNEIDIDKTVGHPFNSPENIFIEYLEPIVIARMPLITFKGKYIIDGHHRWSEVMVCNPEGKMLCFNYDANITIEEMLKAVQGTIAAVMAEKGEKLPANHVKEGNNIFKMSKKDIEKYVEAHENTETYQKLIEQNDELTTEQEAKEFIINNLLELKEDKKPGTKAPGRGYMPQTGKGGSDSNDKQTAFPDKVGSALNRLSTKTIDKKSIE